VFGTTVKTVRDNKGKLIIAAVVLAAILSLEAVLLEAVHSDRTMEILGATVAGYTGIATLIGLFLKPISEGVERTAHALNGEFEPRVRRTVREELAAMLPPALRPIYERLDRGNEQFASIRVVDSQRAESELRRDRKLDELFSLVVSLQAQVNNLASCEVKRPPQE